MNIMIYDNFGFKLSHPFNKYYLLLHSNMSTILKHIIIHSFTKNFQHPLVWEIVMVMMFNTTFNNISVISWLSVLLVEETGVPGENHRPVTSHWKTLSHNVVSSTPHNV